MEVNDLMSQFVIISSYYNVNILPNHKHKSNGILGNKISVKGCAKNKEVILYI